MTYPEQTFAIRDPGVGRVGNALRRMALVGVAAAGSLTEPLQTNSADEVRATFVRGTLVDAALAMIAAKAGPVTLLRVAGDGAGAASAVTLTGTGATAAITETDSSFFVRAAFLAVVTFAGALGTGRVRYSLDAYPDNPSPTFSEETVVPVGGILPLVSIGAQITFVGALVLGDTYTATVQPDYYASTAPATARTALQAVDGWDDMCFAGNALLAADAAAMAVAAAAQQLTLFSTQFVFCRMLVGASQAAAAGIPAAFASVSARFVSAGYGYAGWANPRTEQGRAFYELAEHEVAAIAAATSLISTDLARTANGAFPQIRWISYDSFESGTVLDVARISTFRTWPRIQGYYIANQLMLSSNVSDFRYWQHAGVMMVACEEVYFGQFVYMSSGQRTEAGAINPSDKASIEETILGRLNARLVEPRNAEGTFGHVSDLGYALEALNLLVDETAETETVLVALGYLKRIVSTLGFAKEV